MMAEIAGNIDHSGFRVAQKNTEVRKLMDEHETQGLNGVVFIEGGKKYIECDVPGIGRVRVKPKNLDSNLRLSEGSQVTFDLVVRLYNQGDPVYLAKNVRSFKQGNGRSRGRSNSKIRYNVNKHPGRTHGAKK